MQERLRTFIETINLAILANTSNLIINLNVCGPRISDSCSNAFPTRWRARFLF